MPDEMASVSPRATSSEHSRPSTPGIVRRLPFPGSPELSWTLYRDHVGNAILSKEFRTAAAFFIFGLMNNIIFVIVLSVCAVSYDKINWAGGFGSGWFDSQGRGSSRRCDALLSLQGDCTILFPCGAV